MDYGKAKVILKKLSTLIDSFESLGEPISEIESEMLHKYVDKLSQLIPAEGELQDPLEKLPENPVKRKTNVQDSVEKKSEQEIISPSEVEEKHKTEITKKESVQSVNTEVLTEESNEGKVKVEEKLEPIKKTTPKKEVNTEKIKKKRVLVATEEDDSDGDTSDLWLPVEIKELSHKLSFSPIKNIFKAISINERILTQNELFDGDSKAFKETLDHLESFTNFEDAANYLKKGVAKEHNWEEGKKIKKANNFMKIVQRRFL